MSRMSKTNDKLEKSGIILLNNEPLNIGRLTKFKDCLWIALTTFFIVYGLSGIFLTGFDMPFEGANLVFYIIIASLAFSLIRFNIATYFAGYVGCIGYIVFYTVKNYQDVTSGVNAIMNICIEACDNVFTLPFVRTYMETNSDREATITTAMIMICMIAACVVAFFLSYKYPVGLILFVSVVVVEFSIYLTDSYEIKYFTALFVGIALYIFTLQNNKLTLPVSRKSERYISKRKYIIDRNRVISKKYNFLTSMLLMAIIYLLFTISVQFVSNDFTSKNSSLKNKTDDIVYTVAYKGIQALFNFEIESASNNNGNTPGSFGNVSQMRYTGASKLLIAFVPYSTDSLYLQTFCATDYDSKNRQWTNELTHIIDVDQYGTSLTYNNGLYNSDYQPQLQYAFNHVEGDDTNCCEEYAEASMYIKNVSDDGAAYVMPYYADSSTLSLIYNKSSGRYGSLNVDESTVISYYPWFSNFDEIKECDWGIDTDEDVYIQSGTLVEDGFLDYTSIKRCAYTSKYLDVPDEISTTLEQICEDEGFAGSTDEIVEQIQDYFEDNFSYTLSPGSTPVGEDYVEYFLTEQKQGLCVHFASSACLLLRTLGIPARYCEGYRIDSDEFYDKNKQITAADLTEYFGTNASLDSIYNGYKSSNLGDLPVLVNVTDEDAHAWVEVFYDDIGWVPVEFTVAPTATGTLGFLNSNNMINVGDFPGAKIINAVINIIISIINNIWTIIFIVIIIWVFYRRFKLRYGLFYAPAARRINNQYNYMVLMLKRDLRRKYAKKHGNKGYPINPGEIIISRKKLQIILIGTYKCKSSTIKKMLDFYELYNFGPEHDSKDAVKLTNNFSAYTGWFNTKLPKYMQLYYKFMLKKPKHDLPKWIKKLIEKLRMMLSKIRHNYGVANI